LEISVSLFTFDELIIISMAKIPGEKPQYQKLYERLRKQIIDGKYSPGDLLPSESNLYKEHKVTQPVIRHALSLLVEEGYIKKHQGKGSIVQIRPVGVGIISIEGIEVTSQLNTPEITTRIIKGPVKADLPKNILFGPEEDENIKQFYLLERIRLVTGIPIFHEYIYISDKQLKGFQTLKFQDKSFYETIREAYGIRVTMSRQKFRAAKADKKISKLLMIQPGSPLLMMERKFTTNRPGLYIYSSLEAVTDKFILYSQS
jgi:DNA-binding GntR family transcriptional regulator